MVWQKYLHTYNHQQPDIKHSLIKQTVSTKYNAMVEAQPQVRNTNKKNIYNRLRASIGA